MLPDDDAVDVSKFDDWSKMSHPSDDIICDLKDVTSDMASPMQRNFSGNLKTML